MLYTVLLRIFVCCLVYVVFIICCDTSMYCNYAAYSVACCVMLAVLCTLCDGDTNII